MEYQYGDGTKKLMAFRGNLEPVQVCPKGQLCETISAIPQTQSGNPLIYTSEYNNNLRGLQIAGNSEQKRYEGYNLFDTSTPQSATSYSVAFNVGNGYVEANGTQTTGATTSVISMPAKVESGKTYSGYIELVEGEMLSGGIAIYAYKGRSFLAVLSFVDTPNTKNVSRYTFKESDFDEANPITFRVAARALASVASYNNAKFRMAVVEGSYTADTFPPFEPYVGGVPSPNPQYPQPIINTGDNGLTLSLLGGNLVNLSNISTVGQGSLSFVNSGFALFSSFGGSCRWYIPVNTEPGKKYTLSVGSVRAFGNGNTAPNYIYIGTTNEATEQNVGVLDTTTSNTITFTAPGGTVYIKGTATTGGIGTGVNIQQLMVLEGEYTEQNIPPYEVYNPQKVAQSVTIDDLTLSKIGTVADLLIVDKKLNLAYKSQRFATVNLADCYVQGSAYYDGTDLVFNLNLTYPAVSDGRVDNVLCTHFIIFDYVGTASSNTLVVFGAKSVIANCTLTVEEFEALVNSRAVLVTYLTNTTTNIGLGPDIRPQVLGLSAKKGNTILSVTSELPPSNVTADYYIWGGRE